MPYNICIFHLYFYIDDIPWYENYDLQNIVTPINAKVLKKLLVQAEYNKDKTEYLVDGFTNGFDICYQGSEDVQMRAPNLKLNNNGH